MEANGQVDLSLCQEGDDCHERCGEVVRFNSRVADPDDRSNIYKECEFLVGGCWVQRDGKFGHGDVPRHDILRVTRNGVQITPAVPPANAGPGCDLSRYRTGEAPQIGDRLKAHGFQLHEPEKKGERVYECVVTKLKSDRDDQSIYIYSNECSGEYAARFDLVSRATPAVPPEPGDKGEEKPFTLYPSGDKKLAEVIGDCEAAYREGSPLHRLYTFAWFCGRMRTIDRKEPAPKPEEFVLCGKEDSDLRRLLLAVSAVRQFDWSGNDPDADAALQGLFKVAAELCPKPVLRPFTAVEAMEHEGRLFRLKGGGDWMRWKILSVSKDGVHSVVTNGEGESRHCTFFGDLLACCEFDDGSPCGVLVEA